MHAGRQRVVLQAERYVPKLLEGVEEVAVPMAQGVEVHVVRAPVAQEANLPKAQPAEVWEVLHVSVARSVAALAPNSRPCAQPTGGGARA